MAEDQRRQDLENVAFGDAATPAERLAAQHELARLAAVAPREDDEHDVAQPEAHDEPEAEPTPEVVAPARRSRRLTGAALLAAALIVGLVGGSVITAHLATARAASAVATPTPGYATVANPAQGQVLAGPDPLAKANAILAVKPIPADVYPTAFDLNGTFIASSTRLVATAGPDNRIFIARKDGPGGGFCLLSATVQTTGSDASGSATCADPKQFASQGLTLGEDTFNVVWVGGSIDVTVGVGTRD